MTKKDFELLAKVIRAEVWRTQQSSINRVASEPAMRNLAVTMAALLATTNPRFDRDRFLRACGL